MLSPSDNALQTAKHWLDQAVDSLREASREDYLPRALPSPSQLPHGACPPDHNSGASYTRAKPQ